MGPLGPGPWALGPIGPIWAHFGPIWAQIGSKLDQKIGPVGPSYWHVSDAPFPKPKTTRSCSCKVNYPPTPAAPDISKQSSS